MCFVFKMEVFLFKKIIHCCCFFNGDDNKPFGIEVQMPIEMSRLELNIFKKSVNFSV